LTKSKNNSAEMATLLSRYRESAKLHGEATECGDHKKANQAAEQIAAAYRALRSFGADAQQQIGFLMGDPHPGVRLWSASHSLVLSNSQAQVVLAKLAEANSLIGMSADMTLKEWRAGRLRFE
jgi:hypothetical protein